MLNSKSSIAFNFRGKLDSNGAVTINEIKIDSLIIFSYHSEENSDGGVAVCSCPFHSNVISNVSHNNGTLTLTGNSNIGLTFSTNCPNGVFRVIAFKNYFEY